MHYSVSREDVLVDHARDELPDMASLLSLGYKKQKLRAHSDFYWNDAVNNWVAGFAPNFDIQCESKGKNLASGAIADLIY
jgi:UV DNA damage endonuclease